MRAKVSYWLAPGLRPVELIAADYVAQRFSPHWHAGFAVGAVTRSAQAFRAKGREWPVSAGQLIVLNPGEIHDGFALREGGWSSRMAYIPAEVFPSLAGAEPARGAMPLRFVDAAVDCPALWRAFVAWHRLTESARDVRGHGLTREVFAGLMALMRPAAGDAGLEGASAGLRRRLFALSARGDASVAGLNHELALSRQGAWRRVKAELGLAPKPLLSHLRLMSAKAMIAQGGALAHAALACGYHDQSHLSRQFAAAYGMTPAQFRRAQLAGR